MKAYPLLLMCLTMLVRVSAAEGLSIAWTNNMLRVSGPNIPGEFMETWYLEAFCKSGSTQRNWDQTVIPHKTTLVEARGGKWLRLKTQVEPSVTVDHEIIAGVDEVTFYLKIQNEGKAAVDVQWFQPCTRVDRFTGLKQHDYPSKSFIYTKLGLVMLDKLPREEAAIYKGGQVYVPKGIPMADVNPRPISQERPVNALIGAFSADNKMVFATAWSDTQELFQGVIVCLHNDPRIGGLKAGERKGLKGKMYFLPNDPALLLTRYNADFPAN